MLDFIWFHPRVCVRQEVLTPFAMHHWGISSLSVSFPVFHWGMWWMQLLQAGPDPANSWDFIRNFLTWEISRTGSVPDVVLYWRSCCSSLNQLNRKVVTSVSDGFLLFLRNPEVFGSGTDVQTLGFRLDFLLMVAVDCVHATGLTSPLDQC